MDRDPSAQSADNPDLALEEQRCGDNPLSDRETEQYRNEYITAFADKWDSLIDWDARKRSEGEFFISILRSRHKTTLLDAAAGTGFHSVSLLEAGFDVTSASMRARAFENGKKRGLILKTVKADGAGSARPGHARALEPNGLLIIDQRNYDYMLDKGFKSKHKYYYCGDQITAEPIHIEDDLSPNLEKHYSRILEELCTHRDRFGERASEAYVSNMIKGLERWIEGGRAAGDTVFPKAGLITPSCR